MDPPPAGRLGARRLLCSAVVLRARPPGTGLRPEGSANVDSADVIAELARIVGELASGGSRTCAARELRRLADRISGEQLDMSAAGATPPPTNDDDRALEVFRYWRDRTGKRRARFVRERRQKIRARMREGFTAADLMRAVDGALLSPYHRGENDQEQEYLDLVTILRTGSHVERHVERWRSRSAELEAEAPAASVDPRGETREEASLREAARDALERGDVDAYNDANRRLRAAMSRRNG